MRCEGSACTIGMLGLLGLAQHVTLQAWIGKLYGMCITSVYFCTYVEHNQTLLTTLLDVRAGEGVATADRRLPPS